MEQSLDLILAKGNVITLNDQQPRVEAVGVEGERIAIVGSLNEVKKGESKSTQFINLKGKALLPGFIDSHVHLMYTGLSLLGVDLSTVQSIDEVLKKIKERAKITPSGQWILGYLFNEALTREKRFPTKRELDAVSTEHPIYISHYTYHSCAVNTIAFQQLNISINLEGINKDSKGEIIGKIDDPAINEVNNRMNNLIGEKDRLKAAMAAAQKALQVGITTLHAKEEFQNANFILENKDRLPIRIRILLFLQTLKDVDRMINLNFLQKRNCICLISDGAIETHTAALFRPYTDDQTTLGMLYYSDEEIQCFIEKAHRAGFQISVHCESERSIEQALLGYERALRKNPRKNHRHRIEHFELPTFDQIDRVAKTEVALAMQPIFIPICGGDNLEAERKLLGEERVKRYHPYRTILDKGILVSGGSDSPVTQMNPLKGIQAALTHPNKDQRIALDEAIRFYTINGAKIGFEEKEKGTIGKGKLADFVVLSEDPYQVPPKKIGNINIEMTIVGGKVVYRSKK